MTEHKLLTPQHVEEVYRRAHFLPDAGHTDPQNRPASIPRQMLCFVGALAWANPGAWDHETEQAEHYVARTYGLSRNQVENMESGFDAAMRGQGRLDERETYWHRGYDIGVAMKKYRDAEIRRLAVVARIEPKARYEHEKWKRRKAVEERRARRMERQRDRVLAEAEEIIWRESVRGKPVVA